MQSYRPDKQRFLIERTVPDPPRVIDQNGDVLNLSPLDVVRGVAVLGQNELAELARSPEKLTALLDRFIPPDAGWDAKCQAAAAGLAQSRRDILDCGKRVVQAEERLAALPGLQETLERYRKAGVEEKLKSRDAIIRAEAVVQTARDRIEPMQLLMDNLENGIPFSTDFLGDDALKDLPAADRLKSLKHTLARLEAVISAAHGTLEEALKAARSDIEAVAAALAGEKAASQATYEQALRELQKAKIDGDEFIRLRENIERLKPLQEEKSKLAGKLNTLAQKRRNDLAAWEDLSIRLRYCAFAIPATRIWIHRLLGIGLECELHRVLLPFGYLHQLRQCAVGGPSKQGERLVGLGRFARSGRGLRNRCLVGSSFMFRC